MSVFDEDGVFGGDCIFYITADDIQALRVANGEILCQEEVPDDDLRELVFAVVHLYQKRLAEAS